MVQTGDPTDSGKGGTSIWGRKFEDEFHETLRVRVVGGHSCGVSGLSAVRGLRAVYMDISWLQFL